MKRLNIFYLVLVLVIIVTSCNKEPKTYTVLYQAEVDFYEEDVSIQFTNADGAISGGKLDDLNWTERNRDVWSYNYTATEGSEIYLSGIQTSSFGEVIIRLYVDGVLQQTAVSSSGVRATINHTL